MLTDLVRYHLLLPDVATRKDIDDPAVIAPVAQALRTHEFLDLLHWLTVADAAATGPAAWSPWKENLVELLVRRTSAAIAGDDLVIAPQLDDVPASMWSGHDLDVVVEPVGEAEVTVTIAAKDSVGLLSRCAGALAINRLSVREATSRTQDGRAVIRWGVQTQFGEPPRAESLAADLRRAVAGEIDIARRLIDRERAYSTDELPPPPAVALIADGSSRATVLEVRAHDRVGLLYWVTAALADAGINVDGAKVSTLGSEVVDVFFLTAGADQPLSEHKAQAALEAVRKVLAD